MQKNCLDYPVEFIDGVFDEGNDALVKLVKKVTGSEAPKVLLVADGNVVQRVEGLGSKIGKYVQAHGISLAGTPVVLSGGEKTKTDNLQSALKLVSAILEAKLGKSDCVLALGGGALLDIASYAAAQARGGVRVIRMPTTPAAMFDGAFATYGAVNSSNVKDALRVACEPAAVAIDTSFATSVLDGVWRGGISDAVRLAAVSDGALMKKIAKCASAYQRRDVAVLRELAEAVYKVRAKRGSTTCSEWIAFRLEAMSGYKLPHGYAISIGVCLDSAYAVARKLMKETDREVVFKTLAESGALDGLSHSFHLLNQPETVLFGLDAWKLAYGSEAIILPAGLGKSVVEEVPDRACYTQVMKEFVLSATEA